MPYYRFEIATNLAAPAAVERLRALVKERRGRHSGEEDLRPFVGHVGEGHFEFRQDTREMNQFLPRVRGRILPTPDGARIVGAMHPHVLTLFLAGIFYGFFAVRVASALLAGQGPLAFDLMFLAVLTFVVVIGLRVGFYPEAKWVREEIEQAMDIDAPPPGIS